MAAARPLTWIKVTGLAMVMGIAPDTVGVRQQPEQRWWELGSPTGLTTRITATMTRENTSRLSGREIQLRNAHDGSRPTIRRARPTSFARACARPARRRGSLLKKLRQRHRGLDIRHRWLRPQPPMAALMAWLYRLAAAGVDVRFADLPQIEAQRAASCCSKWLQWRSSRRASA